MRILSFAVELFSHIYEKSNKIYVHKNLSELRQLQNIIKTVPECYKNVLKPVKFAIYNVSNSTP